MGDTIEHVGEVVRVDDLNVQVRIVQTSACSSCVAKGHCNAAESKEKIIDVINSDSLSLKVGDVVKLEGGLCSFLLPANVLGPAGIKRHVL